jgi:hypothetical protein
MTAAWSPAELQKINAARELEIASRRADGTLRRWVPIWAVSTGGLRAWRPMSRLRTLVRGRLSFALASARLTRPSTGAEAALSGWYQPKPQLPHCGLAQKTGHKPPLSNKRAGGTGSHWRRARPS